MVCDRIHASMPCIIQHAILPIAHASHAFLHTRGCTHAEHVWSRTVFPSLLPTTRKEVVQLRKTMEEMLSTLGINGEDEDALLSGETPTIVKEGEMPKIGNIVDLTRIYDKIMQEVVRQVFICSLIHPREPITSHTYSSITHGSCRFPSNAKREGNC
jgi:hypothetical protein